MHVFFFLTLAFFIVAFGQSSYIPYLGLFASSIGFALFWRGMLFFEERKKRFFLALFWFFLVQAVQISWISETAYMGPLILVVYFFLCLGMGLQFSFLSLALKPKEALSFQKILALSGAWVLLEASRLFLLTGFPWNPVGFSMASSVYSLQFAALFGVYGLSFWVFLVNFLALNAFFLSPNRKQRILFGAVALFPFLFGLLQMGFFQKEQEGLKSLNVALVQTSLMPEQKFQIPGQTRKAFSPLEQWDRVLAFFSGKKEPLDLIVLPEGAFPFGAYSAIYTLEEVEALWTKHFEDCLDFPSLAPPFAMEFSWKGKVHTRVSNAFLLQALSEKFQADVIVGLEEEVEKENYNAAFYFTPGQRKIETYKKRMLVPMGEYIPFSSVSWIKDFAYETFGTESSFHEGKEVKVFPSKISLGISICSEEIYTHLFREIRKKGAKVFVTLSNDAWFPSTKLPLIHLEHAKIRAVENGIFILRSSNTGITGIVDPLGRLTASLDPSESQAGVLFTKFKARHLATPYTFWGDYPIFSLSFLFFALFWRKKLP